MRRSIIQLSLTTALGVLWLPRVQAQTSEETPERPSGVAGTPIAVPVGNRLDFVFNANGVQIYQCERRKSGFRWVLNAPAALLFDDRGTLAGRHFAGPTWQATDGSRIVGTKVASLDSGPGAAPALLVRSTSQQGKGRMSGVTFVQRLFISGGVPPKAGCSAETAGVQARAPYRASYYFYKAG